MSSLNPFEEDVEFDEHVKQTIHQSLNPPSNQTMLETVREHEPSNPFDGIDSDVSDAEDDNDQSSNQSISEAMKVSLSRTQSLERSHNQSVSESMLQSPISSLLSTMSFNNHLPPDMCDLTGVWRVDRTRSDSLIPLLEALNVPSKNRELIDCMDVTTTIQHDPLQHSFTVIDTSDGGQHTTSLFTDGVVRSASGQDGKIIVRRASEEDEAGSKLHPLRGGVVRVETRLTNGLGEMIDSRILIDRALMMQVTELHRDNKLIVAIRRFYVRVETDDERIASEKEWEERCACTHLIQKAKDEHAKRRQSEPDLDEQEEDWESDESEEEGDDTPEDENDEEHSINSQSIERSTNNDDHNDHTDQDNLSQNTSSPISPKPIIQSVAAPPTPIKQSIKQAINQSTSVAAAPSILNLNGRWQILRHQSQDFNSLLKQAGLSYVSRLDARSNDEMQMSVTPNMLIAIDRGSLVECEVRYPINQSVNVWHENVTFGGKKGKCRVTVETAPLSITIETAWLRDRRSNFKQIVEPVNMSHAMNHFDPNNSSTIPIGFIMCKLIDVRVAESRSILRHTLQYHERTSVLSSVTRTLKRVESHSERMKEIARASELARNRQSAASQRSLPNPTERDQIEPVQLEIETGPDDQEICPVNRTKDVIKTAGVSTVNVALRTSLPMQRRCSFAASMSPVQHRNQSINPLLSFLPVRLIVSGSRLGELHILLSFLALWLFCTGHYVGCITCVLVAAFVLHYQSVIQSAKSTNQTEKVAVD